MKTAIHFCAISILYLGIGIFFSCMDSNKQDLPKTALVTENQIEEEEMVEPILVRQFSGCKAHQ